MPRQKINICRNWLIYWRVCRKLGIRTLAEMQGCSMFTVHEYLKEHDIPKVKPTRKIRSPAKKKIPDPEILKENMFSRAGVPMTEAVPEEKQEMVRMFLRHLSSVYKEAKARGWEPSVHAFINCYPYIIHGEKHAIKPGR